MVGWCTGVPRSYETASSLDPTEGLCHAVDLGEIAVSYERGSPVSLNENPSSTFISINKEEEEGRGSCQRHPFGGVVGVGAVWGYNPTEESRGPLHVQAYISV